MTPQRRDEHGRNPQRDKAPLSRNTDTPVHEPAHLRGNQSARDAHETHEPDLECVVAKRRSGKKEGDRGPEELQRAEAKSSDQQHRSDILNPAGLREDRKDQFRVRHPHAARGSRNPLS